MSADVGRAAVYAAELAAFDGTDLEAVVGVDALRRLVDDVVSGEWWPGPDVIVRSMRSDARSSNARCDGGSTTTISIAAPQATVATAVHELAHALAGVAAGHDATYRRAHLDVVAVATNLRRSDGRGDLHVEQLRDAYDAAGLTIGSRTWPAPPPVGGPIAL